MNPEYIVIQAGGRGSRLGHLTDHIPKALVPVENLPMMFHLFRLFPEKKYLIIGDYKFDVLRKYLQAFAQVAYLLVDARGQSGTCAGIGKALAKIPAGKSLLLLWSDLILPQDFCFPAEEGNYVGISGSFQCRWSFLDGEWIEAPSREHGVAGLFLFPDKEPIADVPKEGEFVRWLKAKRLPMQPLGLPGTREFGLLEDYQKLGTPICRPFHRVTFLEGQVKKEALDGQGRALIQKECAWYGLVGGKGYPPIPRIDSYEPLVMERIPGNPLFTYTGLTEGEKKGILAGIVGSLKRLHSLGGMEADYFSLWEAYAGKTFARLNKVRDLIPFAEAPTVTINGRECRNVFFFRNELEEKINGLSVPHFCLLHGDCTFSNILLKDKETPSFIDPRGYFGHTQFYGDPDYDWAKLYYSMVGNYDRFNRKEFRLVFGRDGVELTVASSQWEAMEPYFWELLGEEAGQEKIRLLHAIIWLSLTTYAWEDYNAICGAFYLGLYYLEELW
ncbi:MAG: NTP transferase domain-containing protein [Lachnospiraceae bacterium]|jgi:aminoglycoside phosphotransferase|nr:NTP transferase domain-containing protein [Lachnospiraceae bacterium]